MVIPNALTKDTSSLGSSASATISYTGHGFETGDKVIYTAGGTTLGNLTSGNTYYAIKVNANSFKLASSTSNASAGTAITVGGSGGSTTDKFTPPMSLEVLNGDFSNFSAAVSVDIDGQSYEAARLSGIPVNLIKISVYVLASGLAVISGVILTGYVGYVDRFIATGFDLDSIAAAVVGGTAFFGGKGGLVGTIAGVLIIQILSTMVVLIGLEIETQFIIKGIVILAAVSLYGLARKNH